jgi:hypothetical protein
MLIREHERLDPAVLRDAIQRVFDRRATHGIPKRLLPPPRDLAVGYRREAKQVRVVPGLEEAHRLLADWLDPVLAGTRDTAERDTP